MAPQSLWVEPEFHRLGKKSKLAFWSHFLSPAAAPYCTVYVPGTSTYQPAPRYAVNSHALHLCICTFLSWHALTPSPPPPHLLHDMWDSSSRPRSKVISFVKPPSVCCAFPWAPLQSVPAYCIYHLTISWTCDYCIATYLNGSLILIIF